MKINRENEHIESAPLPRIFADIQEDDYNKLEPLAAKMFLAATKRQQLFLYPDKFKNATEAQWKDHFYEEKRSGRVRVRLWISRLSIRLPRKKQRVHGKSVSWKLSKHIFWNRCKTGYKNYIRF